jgi:hypothetical protein
MDAATKEKEEAAIKEEKKAKRKWLSHFTTFLIYGGWLLIVVFIAGVITLISILSR